MDSGDRPGFSVFETSRARRRTGLHSGWRIRFTMKGNAMNPDLDQFDLDVRVITPREQADGFAADGVTTIGTCFTCGTGKCTIIG